MKELRKKKGLSRTELAYKAGVSYASIAAYEAGTRTPNLDAGVKIAKELGVTPEKLGKLMQKASKQLKIKEKTDEGQSQRHITN